jgi:hypothetical protein
LARHCGRAAGWFTTTAATFSVTTFVIVQRMSVDLNAVPGVPVDLAKAWMLRKAA